MRQRSGQIPALWLAFTVGLLLPVLDSGTAVAEDSRLTELTRALRDGSEAAARELEGLFSSPSINPTDRQRIAWLLVTSGNRDDTYIKFLIEQAEKAIEDPMPSPFRIVDGMIIVGEYNERFVAWCSSEGIPLTDAVRRATEELPTAILWLVRAADSRAFDVLMRGLNHPNPLISAQSAHGLGLIGDPRAVGPLKEVARKAPKGNELLYARALAYFDDEEATRLGAELLGGETRFLELRERVRRERRSTVESNQ